MIFFVNLNAFFQNPILNAHNFIHNYNYVLNYCFIKNNIKFIVKLTKKNYLLFSYYKPSVWY